MRTGITRAGAAVLALGIAAASTTCRRDDDHPRHPRDAAGVCATPCNQILVVGADGALSCADATIQIGLNEVAWRTASPTMRLQITFDAPTPFPNLRCASGMCVSGPADPNILPPGSNAKTFGYTVTWSPMPEPQPAQLAAGGSAPGPSTATATPTPSSKTTLGRIIIQR